MEKTIIRLGETTIVIKYRGSKVYTIAVFTKNQPAQFIRVKNSNRNGA